MKEYLGDGVYVTFDGMMLILTTENGVCETNRICLEPSVMRALDDFVKRLRQAHDAAASMPIP